MGYTCETCGQVLQSEGSFGLHNLTAHVAPAPPRAAPAGGQWAPPPPPARSPYASYPNPYAGYAPPPRRSNPILMTLGVIGVVVVVLFVGSLAAITLLGSETMPAQVTIVDPLSPPQLPPGYTHMIKPEEGFLIGVPASFEEMSLSSGDVEDIAGIYEETNPNLAEIMRNNSDSIKSAKLFALDAATGNNENVMRIVLDGAGTVDDVPAGEFSSEYRSVGATGVSEQRVTLPAGDAIKVTATIDAGTFQFRVTQHVLVRDSQVWLLTYTEDASAPSDTGDTIASTFAYTR